MSKIMKKTEAALASARSTAKSIKENVMAQQGEVVSAASATVVGGVLGALEANGRMQDIPAPGPLPRTTWFVFASAIPAMFMKSGGKAHAAFTGARDSTLGITSYNFMRGARMSGSQAGPHATEREEIERMERSLERRRRGSAGASSDIEEEIEGL